MSGEKPPIGRIFERAASALSEAAVAEVMEQDVQELLDGLGYLDPGPVSGAEKSQSLHANRVALLRAAAQFRRMFRLGAPDAPGVVFFGAEVDPAILEHPPAEPVSIGVSGAGLSAQHAFQSCVGEGIEYLSQYEAPQDRLERAPLERKLSACNQATQEFISALSRYRQTDGHPEWIQSTRLSDGVEIPLPADICLRRDVERRVINPPFLLGTGCATGPTFEAAAVQGLLELIERDAASLWWRGGNRGRLIPTESDAYQAAGSMIARARMGIGLRRSWLLDVTTDIDVPCVAAVSTRPDQSDFACGLAAGMTLAAAAQSAIRELCQIELAYAVVRKKRQEGGDMALNKYDWQHLERSTRIDVSNCVLLHPAPPNRSSRSEPMLGDDAAILAFLTGRLAKIGIEVFVVNLTRERFGIPAVRMIAPGLQLEPCEMPTKRLANTIARTGGGEIYTQGVALF
jgi:ribosomal protein S12 methylthiotransferase accessory factor